MSVTITLDMLKNLGACKRVLDRLKERYGKSFTASNIAELSEAVAYSGEPDWCASCLLINRKAYFAKTKIAWEVYAEATEPYEKELYSADIDLSYNSSAYRNLLERYHAKNAPHKKIYLETRSQVFAELYFKENP